MGALTHLSGGESGETDSLLDELVQVVGRNELGAGTGVHVDELGEIEIDAALLRLGAHVGNSRSR